MPSGVRVGTGWVEIVPSMRGFGSAVRREVTGEADKTGREAGKRAGVGFAGAWKAALGGLAALGLGKIAADAATVGIKTAAGMEQARISFTTMLGSAKQADVFLRGLADFAAKTPFDMPGLQSAASSLISAGIAAKDVVPIMTTLGDVTSGMGTGAEGIQRATIAIQQMNAAGRITGEDLNQLRDAGIPVYDLLAAALGKTKAEVAEMASKGKLGKEALDKMMGALKTGDGLQRFSGLMDQQSRSLTGLWSTIQDTFGQGMAKAIAPLVPLIKDGLTAAIAGMDPVLNRMAAGFQQAMVGAKALYDFVVKGDFTSAFSDVFGVEEDDRLVDWLFDARDAAVSVVAAVSGFDWGQVLGRGMELARQGIAAVMPLVRDLRVSFAVTSANVGVLARQVSSLGRQTWARYGAEVKQGAVLALRALGVAVAVAGRAIAAFSGVLAAAAPWVQQHKNLLTGLAVLVGTVLAPVMITAGVQALVSGAQQAAGWAMGRVAAVQSAAAQWAASVRTIAGWVASGAAALVHGGRVVAMWIASRVQAVAAGVASTVASARVVAGLVAQRVASVAMTVASKAMAAGQWLVNAALSANPIGLVVLAIAALVTGIVLAYRHNETFRRIVNAVWATVKSQIKGVADWFVGTAKPALIAAFNAVKSGVVAFGEANLRIWRAIRGGVQAVWVWHRDVLFAGLRSAFATTGAAFRTFGDHIAVGWAKVKAAALAPVKFVVNTVFNDGLRPMLNLVRKVFDPKAAALGKVNLGFYKGGFTGDIDPRSVAGVVHGREYVLTARETEAMGGAGGVEAWKRVALGPGYAGGGYVWPTTSRRLSPNYAGHSGIDIPVPIGTPLYAVASGRIAYAGYGRGYGNAIFLTDTSGIPWVYGHGSRAAVSAGQSVSRGQVIGYSGNTGHSTGPHLHSEAAMRGVFAQAANRAYTLALLSGSATPSGAAAAGVPGSSESRLMELVRTIPALFSRVKSGLASMATGGFGGMIRDLGGSVLGSAARWINGTIPGPGPIPGYAGGTMSARPGWSLVGERGPEWRYNRGGEVILPHGLTPGGGTRVEVHGDVYGASAEQIAVELDQLGRDHAALIAYSVPA